MMWLIVLIGWLLTCIVSLMMCLGGMAKCAAIYGEEAKLTSQSSLFLLKLLLACGLPIANLFWAYEFFCDPTKDIKIE